MPDEAAQSLIYRFEGFSLDERKRVLVCESGEAVALTPKAFDTLACLVRNAGRIVEKDELMRVVWADTAVEESNLSQNVYTLRRVLGDARGEHRYIATVPGRGYQFVASVTQEPNASWTSAATVPSAERGIAKRLPSAGRDSRTRLLVVTFVTIAVVAAVVAFTAGRNTASIAPPPSIRSIAVLPFRPLVPHHRDEALQLGMTESLIGRLASVSELTVVPFSRVRRFSSGPADPLDAGRKLGVDGVLDSSVQRDGERIRIIARLLRVKDGKQLWLGQYDDDYSDIFAVQDSISRRIVTGLAVKFTKDEWARLGRRSTDDAEAYELYLKGRFFVSVAQPNRAVRMFEEATRRDPKFALAYAGLSDIYSRLPIAAEVPSSSVMPRAKEAAFRALDLDLELSEAHSALGWIHFYYDWQWQKSEQAFRRALAMNSSDFSARLGYSHLLSNTGRHEDALRQVDLALVADPESPIAEALKAQFLFHARRNGEAIQQAEKTLAANPNFWVALVQLGRSYAREGRVDAARQALEKARQTPGNTTPLAYLAVVAAASGRTADALAILGELEELAKSGRASTYNVAMVQQALGRQDEALALLERAFTEKDVRMVFLGVEPVWDSLRNHPSFAALVERMRLDGSR